MADPQQQLSSSPNDNVGSGVGNSVVSDLMRVYENLTQSSTPQAGVPDASKTLSLAYNNSGAPQPAAVPIYQPPPGYPIPPNVFQQQQETTAKTALHIQTGPNATAIPPSYNNNNGGLTGQNMISYQHQQPAGNAGYVPVPMGSVTAISVADPNKDGGGHHTQRSGEESHTIMRTSSMMSRTSQVSSQNYHQPAADASSESDKSSGGRSRKKRKQLQNDGSSGSVNGGGKKSGRGKKSKKEDGRWSKRFTWPEDLHRDFVSAIFDVGLKHSSPSTIMEHMPKHEQITNERIKSHLQKYRLHRVKSKKEFISSYEASLRNFQQNQNGSSNNLVSGGAEVAAHLTASIVGNNKVNAGTGSKEGAASNALATVTSDGANQLDQSQNSADGNDSLMLPQLTEAEKGSPIGAAMGYLMGLFFSLKQQLIIQRSLEAAGEKAKGNVLFSSTTPTISHSGSSNIAATNTTAAATASAVAAGAEFVAEGTEQNGVGRSNIEVNSMMKREMQSQMALQNKMRALKQQELDKYKNINKGVAPDAVMTTITHDSTIPQLPIGAIMDNNHLEGSFVPCVGTTSDQPTHQIEQPSAVATQGAGEMAGTDLSVGVTMATHGHAREGSNNLLGIDNSDEFWNTDVMDDQLFEFLMND